MLYRFDDHDERFSVGQAVWVRPAQKLAFQLETGLDEAPEMLVNAVEELTARCTCWGYHDYLCDAKARREARHSQLVHLKGLENPISGRFFTGFNPGIKCGTWVTIIESNHQAQVIAINPDCGEVSLLDYGRVPVNQVRL